MLLYGGICGINSVKRVFVWVIYVIYKVMFIEPVQIINWRTFKCNIHLM